MGVLLCRTRKMPTSLSGNDVPIRQRYAHPSQTAGNRAGGSVGPDGVDALQQQQGLLSQQLSLSTPHPLSAPDAATQHPQQQQSQELQVQDQMRKEQSDHDRAIGMASTGDGSSAMQGRPEAPARAAHRSPPHHHPPPSKQHRVWDQAVPGLFHWMPG